MLQHADSHTRKLKNVLSKCQPSSLSGSYKLCSAAGPTSFLLGFFAAKGRAKANSNSKIIFCSISPTEETFKRIVNLADLTQASHGFSSPRLSPLSLGTDLSVHAHPVKRPIIAQSLDLSGWEAFRRYF